MCTMKTDKNAAPQVSGAAVVTRGNVVYFVAGPLAWNDGQFSLPPTQWGIRVSTAPAVNEGVSYCAECSCGRSAYDRKQEWGTSR